MTRTLVIGATGNIGRQVVLHLAANDQPVRALTRNRDRACMPHQVEVVEGDLTSPESLDRCLTGIDAVFLVWPFTDPGLAVGLGGQVVETLPVPQ